MKKFNPEMKVVRFGAEDVIVTSGKSLTLSNIGNDKYNDDLMKFGGESYSRGVYTPSTLREPLSIYFGDSSLSNLNPGKIMFYINNDESTTLRDVFGGTDTASYKRYNGTYLYDGNHGFVKQ